MNRLLTFCFLLLALSGFGASYYYDSQASGANNGTSWTDAFQTLTAAFAAIGDGSGDTLYISGGTTSKIHDVSGEATPIAMPSGSIGNVFTITVGVDAGHNGIAVLDFGEQSDSGEHAITLANYVAIDGQDTGDGECHLVFANFVDYTHPTSPGRTQGRMFESETINISGVGLNFITVSNASAGVYIPSIGSDIEIQNSIFQQIRGDAFFTLFGATETWDQVLVHSNYLHAIKSSAVPPGASGSFGGPDHFQIGSGVSAYDNETHITRDQSLYTSTQHMDVFQVQGHYVKIYNNLIYDTGDAVFTMGGALDPDREVRDVHIYNNRVVRTANTTDNLTSAPEALRIYGHSATPINLLERIWIQNNTFIDFSTYTAFRIDRFNTAATIDDIRIENNIFYNQGASSSQRMIYISTDSGTAWDSSDWVFNNNVYYHPTQNGEIVRIAGTNYTRAQMVSVFDGNGKTGMPVFSSYSAGASSNSGLLSSGDTVAIDSGATLSSYFTTDYEGQTRSGTWDIGADEYVSGGPDVTAPVVSGVSVDITGSTTATVTFTTDEPATSAIEWGTSTGVYTTSVTNSVLQTSHSINLTGLSASTVHYYIVVAKDSSGNQSTTSESTFDTTTESAALGYSNATLTWIQATNTSASNSTTITNTGGSTLNWTAFVTGAPFSISGSTNGALTADQTATITVDYDPTSAQHDLGTLTITGGGGGAVQLDGIAFKIQPITGLLVSDATFVDGTTQFIITNSYAYQDDEELDPSLAARLILGFEIENAGDYNLIGVVSSPDGGRNSFFLEDNEAPTADADIWDILTFDAQFTPRRVNSRGSGTFDAPQFWPAIYTLGAGIHYIDLRGRERDTQIREFSIQPTTPTSGTATVGGNLRVGF